MRSYANRHVRSYADNIYRTDRTGSPPVTIAGRLRGGPAVGAAAGAGSDAGEPAATLNERYFAGRTDGLRASSGEELLVVTA
jgi:hypothetical protein